MRCCNLTNQILLLYPPFNFAKGFFDVSLKASTLRASLHSQHVLEFLTSLFLYNLIPHNLSSQATATVDFNLGDIVVGPGFWWSDVFDGRTLKVFGNMCRVPALSETFGWFATDS